MQASCLLSFLLLAFGSLASAAEPSSTAPKKKTQTSNAKIAVSGIYSDLKYIPEAGDLLGTEIFIVYGGDSGHFAFIQCSEGWPGRPVLVGAKIEGTRVELSAHHDNESQCPKAKFIGTITRSGLKGTFEGQLEPTTLPRKKSYWQ
jgi:hypothetical protein